MISSCVLIELAGPNVSSEWAPLAVTATRTKGVDRDAMEKKKKLAVQPLFGRTDSICDSEPDFSLLDLDENGNNYSPVLNHRRDEFDVDVVPFFGMSFIFAHYPYLQRPYVRGYLLCRADWLAEMGGRLRMRFLPLSEIANY